MKRIKNIVGLLLVAAALTLTINTPSARAGDAAMADGKAQMAKPENPPPSSTKTTTLLYTPASTATPSAAELPDVGAPPVDSGIVTGIANTAISALSGKYGWFAKFAAVMGMVVGMLRFAFKPTMLVVEAIIHATPSKEDDAALERFERGPVFKWLVWIIDWLTSVKFTSAKPAVNPLVK